MPISDLILENREIIPIASDRFGVVITEEEVERLLRIGYKVLTEQGTGGNNYFVVWISALQRRTGFDLAMLETVGRADVVVSPLPWRVGTRAGIKAYVKTAKAIS